MYEMTNWEAREGTNLNRFEKSQETARSVILVNAPTSITKPGTPYNPANMNKMEKGIFDAHEGIAAEALARQQGDDALSQTVADEARERNIAIRAETEARQQKDNDLAGAIANETQARNSAINAEAKARQQGDDALSQAVADEARERNIAIRAETEARQQKDNDLAGAIANETQARNSAINAEAETRQQKDNDLERTISDINYQIRELINLIENNFGQIPRTRMVTGNGAYLVTGNGDYLVVA